MSDIKPGQKVKGQVTGVTKYGVFVSLDDEYTGMVHISEVSESFVKDMNKLFTIGDIINVKVLEIDESKMQAKLSIKELDYRTKRVTRTKLKESGTGFTLLKENLPLWIEDKKLEFEKNSTK